ncbi:MAG TPA: ABC transporter ATP-binding protein [Jatrophihabitans sp.]|nr:ABC transporter ATP-binding protein [Jatrophihabitans sp.]
MALLTVSDLHAYYGDTAALRGISLEVEQGEIVALLGSNGAGKTTTLRTITGLQRARSGRVVYDDTDITRSKAHTIVRMGVGHVPEGRRIFPALTVEENLRLGGYLSRRSPKVVAARRDAVFDLFPRLVERRSQLGGTLSGGEQQMLAIGRAMMNEPQLLALDEPSMGLAPIVVKAVGVVIRQIRERGTSVLMVEQNARQALALADRAYVLETGRIVLEGPAGELAKDARVRHAYLGGSAEEPLESDAPVISGDTP